MIAQCPVCKHPHGFVCEKCQQAAKLGYDFNRNEEMYACFNPACDEFLKPKFILKKEKVIQRLCGPCKVVSPTVLGKIIDSKKVRPN